MKLPLQLDLIKDFKIDFDLSTQDSKQTLIDDMEQLYAQSILMQKESNSLKELLNYTKDPSNIVFF